MKKKDQFLYLLLLTFVFISTAAFSLWQSHSGEAYGVPTQVLAESEENLPPSPKLTGSEQYPILTAQGALAIDLTTGTPLYQKNPDQELLPASTTKIVTALIALETYSLDDVLVVKNSPNVSGQKMGLHYGESMTVENLLYGLLVYSANDAAITLAHNYPGGYDAFILAMNEKANDLSMASSHFENPVGLDGATQRTTASDLVKAASYAMQNPEFAKIVGTKEITITDITGKNVYKLSNINQLLGSVPGVLGVKTGWTENAMENLVTDVNRDGHTVIIALLGSQDRFGETKQLIDWIYKNYTWK